MPVSPSCHIAPRSKTWVSLVSPRVPLPGPCRPLLDLFLNLNYSEHFDFHGPILPESEVGCACCPCGAAVRAHPHSTERHGRLVALLGSVSCHPKKSHPHLCSQTIHPWDVLINWTEILLGQIICSPLRWHVALFSRGSEEDILPQSHSCFALTYSSLSR